MDKEKEENNNVHVKWNFDMYFFIVLLLLLLLLFYYFT